MQGKHLQHFQIRIDLFSWETLQIFGMCTRTQNLRIGVQHPRWRTLTFVQWNNRLSSVQCLSQSGADCVTMRQVRKSEI
jgi:hypothetical protein